MSAFFDYIRNITYYLLFAALVGFIAPSGKYKKFVSLVMGLILLVLMIQPLRSFSITDIPVTDWFTGITSQTHISDYTYTTWRDQSLSTAFEAQLTTQVEGLLRGNNIEVHSVSFTYTEDFSRITSVRVRVSREEEVRRVPFIRIEPIQINKDDPPESPLAEEVKNLISGFYNLPLSHIHVEIVT
ncbi:MAG: stage III sporulation protein AF [Defluviitaleaceae bacterium]|nr:stage III sporulation protein AF [Defluviitaleaceae bacterium]